MPSVYDGDRTVFGGKKLRSTVTGDEKGNQKTANQADQKDGGSFPA